MNSIISKNKGILPIALFALCMQSVMAQEAVTAQADTINVAFRKSDARDVITPVSTVNVKNLMEKSYSTYSLDNMQALTAGYNGQLWNQGDALVIVDGVPRDANNLLPSEIEDITFLKGASAVVLYGSRASKGAILITTKRGAVKPLEIRVRADYQAFVPKSYPTYIDGAEYMTLYNQALANDGLAAKYTEEDIYNTALGANPYRYPNQKFFTDDYLQKFYNRFDATAEFEGGGKFAQFYTNISYYRQGDLMNFGEGKKNYTDRISIRGNVDLQLSEIVSGWVNASASYYDQRNDNSGFWEASSTLRPNRVAPFIPVSMVEENDITSNSLIKNSKNVIVNPAGVPGGTYFLGGTQEDLTNPFASMYSKGYNTWTSRQLQFDAGVRIDLGKLVKGLSFKTQFAVDYNTSYTTSLDDEYSTFGAAWTSYNGYDMISGLTKYGQDKHTGTLNSSNSAETQTIAWNGQFDYARAFGKHNVNATFVANGYQQSISGTYHKVSNANIGLQASYNYDHKYYADFAANVIHSAKLAEGKRNAFSPSITLGWRLTQEEFLKDVSWLNDLRITAGYTILNQDIDIENFYMYQDIYDGHYWGWSDAQNSVGTGWHSVRGDNKDLDFIKRKEINVGLNGALIDNRVKFSVNYFNTTVDGLLAQPTYLSPSYFSDGNSSFIYYMNYGKNRRSGIDFSLSYNDKWGDFGFGAEFFGQTSTSKNLKVAENVEFEYLRQEGKATDAMFGLECLGYYNSQAEIDSDPVKSSFGTVKPGDLRYKDQNGDNVIDSKDRVVIGRWNPNFFGGFNLTFSYKNFTLFTMFTTQLGGNGLKTDTYNQVFGERKYSDVVRGAWTAEKYAKGEAITYPRLTTQSGDNNFNNASNYWMYKTDRLDLQRVQLTYNFNKSLFGDNGFVKGLQVYVNGNSLFTVAGEHKQMERNVGSAPQTRSFTLGAKVEF